MRTTNLCAGMHKKIEATKCVSRSLKESTLMGFLKTIDRINALPEDTEMFQDRLLSDWKVPSKISGLIYPESVKFDPNNRLFEDLLMREDVSDIADAEVLMYPDFIEVLDQIAGMYKGSVNLDTNLRDLRKKVSLFDAFNRMENNRSVHWSGEEYFIPYRLNASVGAKDAWFNASIEDVTDELVIHTKSLFI